jgi:hypothetical protein
MKISQNMKISLVKEIKDAINNKAEFPIIVEHAGIRHKIATESSQNGYLIDTINIDSVDYLIYLINK